jgi:hypothetical protein
MRPPTAQTTTRSSQTLTSWGTTSEQAKTAITTINCQIVYRGPPSGFNSDLPALVLIASS